MGNILRSRAGRDTRSTIAHARTDDAQHGVRTDHALPRDTLLPFPLPPAAEEACAVWNARSRAPPAAAHRPPPRAPQPRTCSPLVPTQEPLPKGHVFHTALTSRCLSSRRVSEASQQRGGSESWTIFFSFFLWFFANWFIERLTIISK